MLRGDDSLERLSDAVGPLECSLQLPVSPDEFFSARGMAPIMDNDKRRFVRSHLRVVAALQHRQSIPSMPRVARWFRIVTCNVSRNGIRFLHGEQLYPSEKMKMLLPDGKLRGIEVVRCRRLASHCFEVGARFIDESEILPPAVD